MPIVLKPLFEQVFVITGASSGIGLATARAAVEAGAQVLLTARSGAVLERVVSELGSAKAAAFVVADVARRDELEAVAREALRRFGRFDTWVNNAGVAIYGRLEAVSEEDSRRLFDTNFWGVVNGSLVALPHLRRTGGALINVGSEASEAVIPLQGMVSASKHAVKGFTDALRLEVEEMDGASVAITLVQPAAVNTPYPQHARNYMDREPKLPTAPIDPEQVAQAILRAASHHERDVKVGMGAKVSTFLANNVPAVADRIAAKQADRQQYDEPPRHPEGTLYEPGATGDVRGGGPARTAN